MQGKTPPTFVFDRSLESESERLQKNVFESVRGREKDAYLEAEDLRLDQRQGTAVDLDETTASLDDEINVSISACLVEP